MADFGKLNLAVSFKPTSAFPLDARCYFTSLEAAQAAAATAEEVGSTNSLYYYGQKLLVYENDQATWFTIQPGGKLVKDIASDENSVSLLVDGVSVAVDNTTVGETEEENVTLEVQ